MAFGGGAACTAIRQCWLRAGGTDEPEEAREGYFEIRTADSQLVDGVHMLDARMQLVLSSEALEALSSGFTLTIELQVELIRVRRWYLDDLEAELATRYELEYSPLSQRYIVRNLNSGEQDSFATLYSALNNLGRVQRLPLIDDTLLESDSELSGAHTRAAANPTVFGTDTHALFLAWPVATRKRMD